MPVFSAMPPSSFEVSMRARATSGRRRALISKSSRETVRLSTRIDPGASALICAIVCRSVPPDAGSGFVTETVTGAPPSSVKEPSILPSAPASTFPFAPPPVL
jgi:hypothetical protein